MALNVPESFLTDRRARPANANDDAPSLFRLAPHHAQTLRDVAQGVEESDVGLACSYLVDQSSGEGADYDEHALDAIERYVDRAVGWDQVDFGRFVPALRQWRQRLGRCRRALRRLRERGDHESANVLMVAHGHADPIVRQLPELARLGAALGSLARYTDVVEARRRDLAKQLAADAGRRFDAPLRRLGAELRGLDPATDAVERQSGSERARAALAMGLDAAAGNARVVDLARVRDRHRWADRSVASSDALRDALAPFCEPAVVLAPGEPKLAYEARRAAREARKDAHRDRAGAFVTALRLEAARMLSDAERAYHAAWLAVPR